MGGGGSNKLPKPQLTFILLLLAFAASFHHSDASLSSLFYVNLFPLVNVTFTNESNHSVDLVCSAEAIRNKVIVLGPGEELWWTVRDVLFPLVWCYVEISEEVWGVFWGYQAKLRCFHHCDWRIRESGMWLLRKHDREEDLMWLNQNGGGF